MRVKIILFCLLAISPFLLPGQVTDALKWKKYELAFTSSVHYENPVQDLKMMEVPFTSPTGRFC